MGHPSLAAAHPLELDQVYGRSFTAPAGPGAQLDQVVEQDGRAWGTRMGAWTRHRGRRHDPTSILPRSTLLPTARPLSVRLADRGCMCSVPPSILDYHSDSPTFALAFSPLSDTTASLKLAVGSFNDTRNDSNNITVISLDPSYLDLEDDYDDSLPEDSLEVFARQRSGSRVTMGSAFQPVARAPHPYPPSSIAFSPATLSGSLQGSHAGTAGEGTREMVASSSECLRLWDLVAGEASGSGFVGQGRQGGGSRLVQRAVLANSKADYSAPLTSFSWSTLEPTHIVTSSIDTTCTVWDISTQQPITQLIAHDREVFDVAWSPSSRDVFASVGADGSVRMFDLRSLEHSTILYEAAGTPLPSKNGSPAATTGPLPSPLLRLAFSPTSPTYLSVCHSDSSDVQILDTRSPGTPAMEVRGHKACVNGMAWGGSTMAGGAGETSGPGWLATCSDDSTLLLWDLTTTTPTPAPTSRSTAATPKVIRDPVLSYSAPSEINAVAWGGGGQWVAAGCGRLVRCLKSLGGRKDEGQVRTSPLLPPPTRAYSFAMSPLAKVHSSLQSLYTAVLTKQPSTGAPSPAIHREHIAPVPSEQLKDQLEREGAERKQRRSKVEEGVDRDEPGVGKPKGSPDTEQNLVEGYTIDRIPPMGQVGILPVAEGGKAKL